MTKLEIKLALIAALKKAIQDTLGYEPLEKGSLQSKMPFNPQRDVAPQDKLKTALWQTENFQNEIGKGQKYRDNLPRLEGPGRDRALLKLQKQTQVRKAPDGKREFLLHRGMGEEEHRASVGPAKITQAAKTSWTPDIHIAKKLGRGKLLSAWIHEDKIHTIPRQLGEVGSYSNYYKPGEDPLKVGPQMDLSGSLKGRNLFNQEKEVVVNPHESSIETNISTPATKSPEILQAHRDRLYKRYHAILTHQSEAYKDDGTDEEQEARRTKHRELEALRNSAEDSALAAGLPEEELESLRTQAINKVYYGL